MVGSGGEPGAFSNHSKSAAHRADARRAPHSFLRLVSGLSARAWLRTAPARSARTGPLVDRSPSARRDPLKGLFHSDDEPVAHGSASPGRRVLLTRSVGHVLPRLRGQRPLSRRRPTCPGCDPAQDDHPEAEPRRAAPVSTRAVAASGLEINVATAGRPPASPQSNGRPAAGPPSEQVRTARAFVRSPHDRSRSGDRHRCSPFGRQRLGVAACPGARPARGVPVTVLPAPGPGGRPAAERAAPRPVCSISHGRGCGAACGASGCVRCRRG